MIITDPAELLRLAADPNVSVANASRELLRGALELAEEEYSAAEDAGGADMVRRRLRLEQVASRLAWVAGVAGDRRTQSRFLAIAKSSGYDRTLWLLASRLMTNEQHAELRRILSGAP